MMQKQQHPINMKHLLAVIFLLRLNVGKYSSVLNVIVVVTAVIVTALNVNVIVAIVVAAFVFVTIYVEYLIIPTVHVVVIVLKIV